MKKKIIASITIFSLFIAIIAGVFQIIGTNLKDIFNSNDKELSDTTFLSPISTDDKNVPPVELTGIKEKKIEYTEKVARPKQKMYFDQSVILPNKNATALLIKSSTKSYTNLQTELSQSLIVHGISNSTTLFRNSGTYYDYYLNANSDWLDKIDIVNHTPSYIVGKVKENVSLSSTNSKITIISLSFYGRYVDTKSNRIIPISIKKENSSFNKENAFSSVYKEMSDSIANLTKFLMTK